MKEYLTEHDQLLIGLVMADKRLSWKSKGMWMYLYLVDELQGMPLYKLKQISQDGATGTTRAMDDLIEYGYIERELSHGKGQGVKVHYSIPADKAEVC